MEKLVGLENTVAMQVRDASNLTEGGGNGSNENR